MNFKLKIWRQHASKAKGEMKPYKIENVSANTSFLEMLDILNEQLINAGDEPVAFDSDCREGICGTCCLTINGEAHGPSHPAAACQLYMREFKDGATITVEPFRVRSFPLRKDLVLNRSAPDRTVPAVVFLRPRPGSPPGRDARPGGWHRTMCEG